MDNADPTRSPDPRIWCALWLIAASAALFWPVAAQGTSCGMTIVSNLTLEADLTCAGTALVVDGDNVTLDLEGHTITGTGTGAGVLVTGRTGVTITNGAISNFEAGVRILDSAGVTIKDALLSENTDGVDCAAGCTSSTIRDSEFHGNRARGVMVRTATTDVTIKGNRFSADRVGVLLFGCVGCTVKDNFVTDALLAGIRINVLATANDVKGNRVSGSPAGIEFLITQTGSSVGNTIAWNSLSGNECGLKGPLAGNVVKGTTFSGNAADVCP